MILFVFCYDDIDEVISCVNDFLFGLGVMIWGKDFDWVKVVVVRIDVGMVWINWYFFFFFDVFMGGIK